MRKYDDKNIYLTKNNINYLQLHATMSSYEISPNQENCSRGRKWSRDLLTHEFSICIDHYFKYSTRSLLTTYIYIDRKTDICQCSSRSLFDKSHLNCSQKLV